MSAAANPISWMQNAGVNLPNPAQPQNPNGGFPNLFSGPAAPSSTMQPGTASWGNPGGFGNPQGGYENQRNVNTAETENEQLRNELIPSFANQLFGYAGQAAPIFRQFANLGSPYYQQQQRASWEQGVRQAQNAAAQARQQLAAQGYGYTPSGTEAGMIGGMGTGSAQNLTQTYLQNLFNNEQMQMQGANALAQLAGLFNPSGLFGGGTSQVSIPSNFFQNATGTLQSIFGNKGVGSVLPGGYTGGPT